MPKKKTWWVEMEFIDFCIHYMKMNDADVVKDVRDSIDALMAVNPEGESFGSKMVRKANDAMERISATNRKNAQKRWENGTSKCPLPKNKSEVIDFASDNGLDVDDASEWAEINLKERKGKDASGKPIKNWKGALVNYCKAMKEKRSEPA